MGSDEGHGLADRVAAMERLQQADRRALGSLDADLSDLQSQRRQDVRLLQSLRETQVEQNGRLERLESGMSAGFSAIGARLEVIVDLLRRDSR